MAVLEYIRKGKKHYKVCIYWSYNKGKQKQKWFTNPEWTTEKRLC